MMFITAGTSSKLCVGGGGGYWRIYIFIMGKIITRDAILRAGECGALSSQGLGAHRI
jgi:hypothetical protein